MHRCRPRRLLLYGDSGGLGASWRPRYARIASNVVDQSAEEPSRWLDPRNDGTSGKGLRPT